MTRPPTVPPAFVLMEGGKLNGQTIADDTYPSGGVQVGQEINPFGFRHRYRVTDRIQQNERFMWCRVAAFVRDDPV